ncbi:hypothetical protein LENED_010243 [Lentinula edodes]|uniref:DUF6533 domain-containing protein n=1 Tax=Lentinula edodes TaxID=5353 RepID=A0A1Q3ELV7_LENED|nr:hypothetical protein LENED_010243 [Lentinula edodes]
MGTVPELHETDLYVFSRARYLTGVALIIVFYDHLLTLHEEFSTIWRTKKCHNYVWVFSLVGVGVTSVTQLYMILRVYSTWDKRRSTTVILVTMFVIFIAALTPNAILALIDVQSDSTVQLGKRSQQY